MCDGHNMCPQLMLIYLRQDLNQSFQILLSLIGQNQWFAFVFVCSIT